MAWRSIALSCCALWVGLSACSAEDELPTVPVSRGSDAGHDAGQATEVTDAAPDAAEIRGETPRWPEAEQEIELPYGGPPVTALLTVAARPGALDVHLNVDTTSSIRFAIDELQVALRGTVITRLRSRVDDVAFGVSRFADFPVAPFGNPGSKTRKADRAFVLLTPVTTNVDRVMSAVARLDQPLDHGGDLGEASAEALYQVATGAGYSVGSERLIERGPTSAAFGGGTLGGVGFRDNALHVVLHVADSPSHTPDQYEAGGLPGTRTMAEAAAALRGVGARVVSIIPTPCEAADCRIVYPYAPTRAELSALAVETGAITAAVRGSCRTGIDQTALPPYGDVCPFVFDARADGTGLSRTLSDAVLALLEEVRWNEVHAEPGGDQLGFLREIRAEAVPQSEDVPAPELRDRLPSEAPDGSPDSYVQVDRRSLLGFRVTLQNDRIAARDEPQRFRIAVRVLGDSVLLEERLLRVLVPALRRGAPPTESSGHVADDSDSGAGG